MTRSAKHILAPAKRYKPSPQVLGSSRFASGGIDSEGRYIRQQTIVEATPEEFEGPTPAPSNFQGQNHVLQRGLKSYELTNHLGNVMATVSDRKRQSALSITALPIELGNECFPSIIGPLLPASAKFFLPDVRSVQDYEPGGMLMPGRNFSANSYRYGFNGKEKDDEIKGAGNSVDFGARIYDPRLFRWLSLDPLASKYPDLSPYNFCGNNPIRFVDFDGRDFGVKINHTNKTIVIVANVYTTSSKAYNQALKAAGQWNAKSTNVDGYTVTFQVKVQEPVTITNEEAIAENPGIVKKNGKLRNGRLYETKNMLASQKAARLAKYDGEGGNVFAANSGQNSHNVSGERYTGGQTENGRYADMNTHDVEGDLGVYEDLVTHEFGHLFGLDDQGKGPHFSKGGIMEYKGTDLAPISDDDVKGVLNFAKAALSGNNKATDAKVKVIENTGKSDGTNPIGLKNE